MTKEEIRDVLGLWYYQELFAPVRAEEENTILNSVGTIDWDELRDSSTDSYYRVYGGHLNAGDLEQITGNSRSIAKLQSTYDSESAIYFLCLDKDGRYVENSFSLVNAVWALSKLSEDGDKALLDLSELHQLNEGINRDLKEANPIFTSALIRNLSQSFAKLLFRDKEELLNTQNYKITPETDPSNLQEQGSTLEFLKKAGNSAVKENLLGKYIGGITRTPLEVGDLNDTEIWIENLKPYDYSNVAWPKKSSNTASKQWIINDIYKSKLGDIKSYQVPRGSKRQNIIADVLAQQVHKRATMLNKINKPADAFTMRKFSYAPRMNASNYYSPLYGLNESSLLLISDNEESLLGVPKYLNDADLMAKAATSTSFDLTRHKEIYFTNAANAIFSNEESLGDEVNSEHEEGSGNAGTAESAGSVGNAGNAGNAGYEVWGLAGVYVENLEDLKNLVNVLIEHTSPDNEAWQELRDSKKLLSFRQAKQEFVTADDAVNEKLTKINANYESASTYYGKVAELEQLHADQENLEEDFTNLDLELTNINTRIKTKEEEAELRKHEIEEQSKQVNFWKKLIYRLFSYGEEARLLANSHDNLKKTQEDINNLKAELEQHDEYRQSLLLKEGNLHKEVRIKTDEINLLTPQEELNKAKYGKNYVDRDAYLNFNTAEYQRQSPWVDSELIELRENLFKASLNLQKAFILESNEIEQNLNRFKLMLDGQYQEIDVEDAWQKLFNTIQLIVPMLSISRELAEELFLHSKEGENGSLIYLEPERNSASELLASVYISDRAIFLGDYLQLTPLKEEPIELGLALAKYAQVADVFVDPIFGAVDYLVGLEKRVFNVAEKDTPFPIRTQSRLIEPLHSIHNGICLDDLLHGKAITIEPKVPDLIEYSAWPVIKTETYDDSMFTVQTADLILQLLKNYFIEHGIFPDLGIAFYYSDALSRWREYSAKFVARQNDLGIPEDEIVAWIQENSFLLTQWDGESYDEIIFFAGGSSTSPTEYIDLFTMNIRPLHTLFNMVRRKLLFLADPTVWAQEGRLKELYETMSENGANNFLRQKETVFVTIPEDLDLLDDDLVQELKSSGVNLTHEQYYAFNDEDLTSAINELTDNQDSDNINFEKSFSYNYLESGEGSTLDAIFELLNEMERFSYTKSTVFVSREWLHDYLSSKEQGMHQEKFKGLNLDNLKDFGSVLNCRFYKVSDKWILSSVSLLKE